VKIEIDGKRYPLGQFAAVRVKGADLLIDLYDEKARQVSRFNDQGCLTL
jgi:hypothetical protein